MQRRRSARIIVDTRGMGAGQPEAIAAARVQEAAPPTDTLELRRVVARIKGSLLGSATPVRLGRYELRQWLGAGAFGTVYVARDPRMQREVAIKVLHPLVAVGDPSQAAILREARAQARITDPHVVEVFDLGWAEGRAYVVMRRVDGGDLESWWRTCRPRPDEIMDAVVQAALGLAAAHDAGLVHCDVKPSNLLRTDAGVVRVSDFGLAVATRGAQGGGTPIYMSPEQRAGGSVDARSDQYALAKVAARLLGSPDPALPARPPTAALSRVLSRAMRIDPRERFSSMHAFASALRRASQPSAARALAWAGAASAAALALGWSSLPGTREHHPVACDAAARHEPAALLALAFPRWSPVAQANLRARVDAPFGSPEQRQLDRVVVRLDAHLASWSSELRLACERLPNPVEIACLDTARTETRALLDAIDEADTGSLAALAAAVQQHVERRTCTGASFVEPPALRGLAQLDAAAAALQVGAVEDARRILTAVVDDAAVAYGDAVLGQAAHLLAKLEIRAGNTAAAGRWYQAAFGHASAAGDAALAVESASELSGFAAERQDHEAAWRWLQDARVQLDRAGAPPRLRATWSTAALGLYSITQDRPRARAAARDAVAAARSLGLDEKLVTALHGLAVAELLAGDPSAAELAIREAIADLDALLGPNAHRRGQLLDLLGGILVELGRPDLATQREAVAALSRSHGPTHEITHAPRLNLAGLLLAAGEAGEATSILRTLVDELDAVQHDARTLPVARQALAQALRNSGQLGEAAATIERALVELEGRRDRRPGMLGDAYAELAAIERARGDHRAASRAWQRAAGAYRDDGEEESAAAAERERG
ncbi:MAG: serine/threonine protein kinase [Deltaproteobacteria bacterium]|nr:serine/threonine protein kinase [Deltaproteobacteria bacterium]